MSILDTIDGALRDYEASGDAMRWVPEEHALRSPAPIDEVADAAVRREAQRALEAASVSITIDTSQFEAAMWHLGEQIAARTPGVLARVRPWGATKR